MELESKHERIFDEQGIECFQLEKVLNRRHLPSKRALEYLVKWLEYDDIHNTWITKKEVVSSGALKLLTDFDKLVLAGNNLP